jgi:hypothetical protein
MPGLSLLLLTLPALKFLLNKKDELRKIVHAQPVQFTRSNVKNGGEVTHKLITQCHYVSAQ